MKQCTKCKEFKNENEFYKNKRCKDGLRIICKKCESKRMKIYNQKPENKKRSRELQKIRRQRPDVKEKRNEYAKEYYHKNKEKIKKYQRENRDKINKRQRQRYNTDIEYKNRSKDQYNKYMNTNKGKIAIAKRNNKRKRNLKTIILINNIFPKEIKVEYHHIHNFFVILLPKITHRYINGFNKNKSHIKHNEKVIDYGLKNYIVLI